MLGQSFFHTTYNRSVWQGIEHYENYMNLASGWELTTLDGWVVGNGTSHSHLGALGTGGGIFNGANTQNATVYEGIVFAPNQWAEAIYLDGDGATTRRIGVCVRCSVDTNSYYAYQGGDNASVLGYVVGNTITAIATGGGWVEGSTYRLEVIGSNLYCYKDGVLTLSGSHTAITTGKPGIAGIGWNYTPTLGPIRMGY